MASESVQDGERQAITEWCNDSEWEQRDGALAPGVWRRLARVDRAMYASNAIAQMLVRDHRGKADAQANEGIIYQGLSGVDAEALSLAMIELGNYAEDMLGEVRENYLGCCGPSCTNSRREVQA